MSISVFIRTNLNQKDVWSDIQVATHPDAKVGRRGSKISVCKYVTYCFVMARSKSNSSPQTKSREARTRSELDSSEVHLQNMACM